MNIKCDKILVIYQAHYPDATKPQYATAPAVARVFDNEPEAFAFRLNPDNVTQYGGMWLMKVSPPDSQYKWDDYKMEWIPYENYSN